MEQCPSCGKEIKLETTHNNNDNSVQYCVHCGEELNSPDNKSKRNFAMIGTPKQDKEVDRNLDIAYMFSIGLIIASALVLMYDDSYDFSYYSLFIGIIAFCIIRGKIWWDNRGKKNDEQQKEQELLQKYKKI